MSSPPSCLHRGDSARKLVSRIVLTTSAPSPRCCRVVMLEAARRPRCSGGGVDPHGCVSRWGVARWGEAGPPISPGMPQATDQPTHIECVCGSPVAGKSSGSPLLVLAARGTGGPCEAVGEALQWREAALG